MKIKQQSKYFIKRLKLAKNIKYSLYFNKTALNIFKIVRNMPNSSENKLIKNPQTEKEKEINYKIMKEKFSIRSVFGGLLNKNYRKI